MFKVFKMALEFIFSAQRGGETMRNEKFLGGDEQNPKS